MMSKTDLAGGSSAKAADRAGRSGPAPGARGRDGNAAGGSGANGGPRPSLVRRMGLADTAFLVIGAVVGSGIFMTSGLIAADLPSPGLILAAWAAGGLITVFGALTFAELGAMFPRAGGQYVYIREAMGRGASFFFGWTFFWFIMCGGIAALAVGFAEFAGSFVPAVSPANVLAAIEVFGLRYALSAGQVLAVAAVLLLTALHTLGLRLGIAVQNALTVIRIGSVLGLVVLGLAIGRKAGWAPGADLFPAALPPGALLRSFGLALIAVFWTYDGWYSVSCTAEEIRNPRRNIPLGLIIGTLTVTALYLLVNLVYILAVPVERMAGVVRVGELASAALFGPAGAGLMSVLITVSVFGCLHATILYGPRVYYAMARDGVFFRSLAFVHPRYRVPTRALWAQAAWSSVLCLSGTYASLFAFVIFAVLLFFAGTGAAVIVLRRRRPELARPYRAWGYPVVPLVFILACLGIFINTVAADPGRAAVGFGLMAAGLPAYLHWRGRRTREQRQGE